jgi:glutaredoxin 3
MGRITVFATDGCRHCKRTLAALEHHKLPYTVISLSQYPEKRSDMLKVCNYRSSTPQVFFNTRHVGGADDTIKLLAEWRNQLGSKGSHYDNLLERYDAEIGRQPNPNDPRLSVPDYPPKQVEPSPPRSDELCIELPNGAQSTVLEMTEMFRDILKFDDHVVNMVAQKNAFTGKEVVLAIMKIFDADEEEAKEFASYLQRQKLWRPLAGIEADTTRVKLSALYRLQCYETPSVLNSYRIWTETVDSNSMRLLLKLTTQLQRIEDDCMDDSGMANLCHAARHKEYAAFQEAICELQGVDLGRMEDDETRIVSR